MTERRSYDLKLDRAEKHLIDIESLIADYAASHPYEVLPGMEGKDRRWRLHFTAQPSDDIPVIVGDFLYNVRASLDYIMAAIAPASNRSRVNYPILWQGVWEPAVEGDDKQRSQDRATWQRYTTGIDPAALTIIQMNQPAKSTRDGDTHALSMLNRLRNRDAHSRLTIVATSLAQPVSYAIDRAGRHYASRSIGDNEGLPDGAILFGIPHNTVKVEMTGTPTVFIRLRAEDAGGYLISGLRALTYDGTRRMLDLLRPYDRLNRT